MSELNITKVVGLNMKQMRQKAEWSMTYVAKMMEMALQNYSGIEKGTRGLSTKQIEKACEVFHCHPVHLFLPPDGTDRDKMLVTVWDEMHIMDRANLALLLAHAVAINAQKGIKPE